MKHAVNSQKVTKFMSRKKERKKERKKDRLDVLPQTQDHSAVGRAVVGFLWRTMA